MSVKDDLSPDYIQTQILEACTGKDLLTSDWISDLPDDILINRILSLLTLKEAGATSVLSKRWRHAWAYVPSLDFDDFDVRRIVHSYRVNLVSDIERNNLECKYVGWVDQVVRSYKADTVDEFNIRYGLDNSRKDEIDKWLRFAMEKRVKRLQVDISMLGRKRFCKVLPYTFPSSLSSWNHLTSLELHYVEFSGEFLDKILCDCQNLEFLAILGTSSVRDLKIVGPDLNLKHLAILSNFGLNQLEISAPNLISFRYNGGRLISSPFKSTPKLSQVIIGGMYAGHLLHDFSHISSCMSHIEELQLHAIFNDIKERDIMKKYSVGSRLKILRISVCDPLFCLSSLIKACPFIHKLVIEIFSCDIVKAVRMSKKEIKSEWFRHNHLKILEISGFGGSALEMRFAKHLIRCAPSLDKVIIQTGHFLSDRGEQNAIQGREQAKLLAAVLKPGMELQVRSDSDDGSRPGWNRLFLGGFATSVWSEEYRTY